jgi:hypothetical protein
MASALSAEMPTSTSVSCACVARRSPSNVANASAADAPQIATAPPAKAPNELLKPSQRAARTPLTIVSAATAAMAANATSPRSAICPVVMRRPTSTMPIRSNVRDAKARPGASRSSAPRKFMASPTSNAIKVSGAP